MYNVKLGVDISLRGGHYIYKINIVAFINNWKQNPLRIFFLS